VLDTVRHIEHNEALCHRTEFCDLERGLLRLVCFANRDFSPLFRRLLRSINRLIGTGFVVDYISSFWMRVFLVRSVHSSHSGVLAFSKPHHRRRVEYPCQAIFYNNPTIWRCLTCSTKASLYDRAGQLDELQEPHFREVLREEPYCDKVKHLFLFQLLQVSVHPSAVGRFILLCVFFV
jgi:hypothetical protein